MYCKKCGNILDDDAVFCEKCGTEIVKNKLDQPENNNDVGMNRDNDLTSNNAIIDKPKKSKKPLIIGLIGLVVVGGVVLALFFLGFFTGMEGYLEKGNYEKAYAKAETAQDKLDVYFESLVAESYLDVDSNHDTNDHIKQLSSAYVWSDEGDSGYVVLGLDSEYSNLIVTIEAVYNKSKEDMILRFDGFGTVAGLEADSLSQAALDLALSLTKLKGVQLSSDAIKRINMLKEDDRLQDIVKISQFQSR